VNEPQAIVWMFVIGAVVLFGMAALFNWSLQRRDELLAAWAERHGYRILAAEPRPLQRGPFSFNSTNSQQVFRVTIEQSNGDQRSGWVRFGDRWSGLRSDAVEEVWDDEAARCQSAE
jgi:hypothetical protein